MNLSTGQTKGSVVDIDGRAALRALLVAAGYYCGAKIAFTLSFPSAPIALLSLHNAVVLAGLLSSPVGAWWLILLAVVPAHLASQWQSGVPVALSLGWLASNCIGAMLGAAGVHYLLRQRLRVDWWRHVAVLLLCCAWMAPFASALLAAALVKFFGWGDGAFWPVWRAWWLSNVLAMLVLLLLLAPPAGLLTAWRNASRRRRLEGGALVVALLAVGAAVYGAGEGAGGLARLLLYAPLPILLWAALRFAPAVASAAFLLLASLAVVATLRGGGPFGAAVQAGNALPLQLCLIGVAVPLLLLSAAMQARRRAQASPWQRQQRLSLALAAACVGTWELDLRTATLDCSRELRALLDLEGQRGQRSFEHVLARLHPADVARTRRLIARAAAQGSSFEVEFRLVRPNGELRWLLSKGGAAGGRAQRCGRLVGVSIDVTERKRAEALARDKAALRGGEARWRQLADAVPQPVWAARPDGWVDYANRHGRARTGRPARPAGCGPAWVPFIHPRDRAQCMARWRDALAGGRPFDGECRIRFPRVGAYRWYLAHAVPLRDAAGAIVRWYGSASDIDARKRAEQAQQTLRTALQQRVAARSGELRRARRAVRREIAARQKAAEAERMWADRLANVLRLSPDAMAISGGLHGPILEVNERWQQLFGYRRAEVIGKTARQLHLYPGDYGAAVPRGRGNDADAVRELAVAVRHRDGAVLHTVVSAGKLDGADDSAFLTIWRDVTEQRRRDAAARQQRAQLTALSRVALLGELSGALAHELNQPLAAILANAQAARRFLQQAPPDLREIGDILADIVHEDQRAAEVIRCLRALFRQGEPARQRLDVNQLVRDALVLTQGTLVERKVGVILELGSGLGVVQGDLVQLQQVLLNLIVNACEAMGATAVRRLGLATGADGNRHLQIVVSDTGPGIAPEVIGKVFDAFFTTKAQGLGCGLSITRAIIVQHGGRIEAANRAGGGTVFRITLPLAGGLS